jgi:cyclopropane-fatty-acyl-phospholipid synthase
MLSLFSAFLSRLITRGELEVIDPSGACRTFGPGGPPRVRVRIGGVRTQLGLLLDPELRLGETYMDGTLAIEEGTLGELLELCIANPDALARHPLERARRMLAGLLRFVQHHNPVRRARANAAHHYDLSGALYRAFLDRDMQYSCAYFARGNETLEEAQEKKKAHIAAKLLLEPGMKVLDIGSGWGGLGLYLAREAEVEVTGLTLSREQLEVTRRRAAASGLARRVRAELKDYRQETGRYDRIVSVGMFEHVGARHYREFFARIGDLLKEDGIALLHSIGRMSVPGTTNPWIRRYIFPGGYCPALSEVLAAVERAGLWVTDIEILRLHYADTLREWARRFAQHRERIAKLYDERFCRMWEFYLAVSENAFRNQKHMVFQIQLARRKDAAPITRDYMMRHERRLLATGRASVS